MSQSQVQVPVRALWGWTTGVGQQSVASTFPTTNGPTKTGLLPQDVKDYAQVPIQRYGNPPVPISDTLILQWIRWAEDDFEQGTNIRLCQTWIAAPPVKNSAAMSQLGLTAPSGDSYQQLGVDYDLYEPGYDFFFRRAQDEGWLYNRMRWRPVQSIELFEPASSFDASNSVAIKNVAFIYPLLNQYFRMPSTWVVEDQRRGLIRFVPATNVQMLPLFAMQLAFMGFAESVPGAMWFQYTAGLTANDYNSEWSFVKQAVLAKATAIALGRAQLSVNLGALETQTQVDGLSLRMKYSEKGPFSGQITQLETEAKALTRQAKTKCAGPMMGSI